MRQLLLPLLIILSSCASNATEKSDKKVTTETNVDKLEKIKTSMLVKIYQDYLEDTDHKFYGDYEPKVDEDLELVRTKRSEARAFVRAHKEEV